MDLKTEVKTEVIEEPHEAPTASSSDIKVKLEEAEVEDEGERHIPSILESITQEQIDEFKPFHERYFQKKYCTKFSKDSVNLDTCIRVHTNKVCLVFLSEKHSIIKNQQKIQQLNFQISPKINRLKNEMSGKGKRGAQLLQPDSVLCRIETVDGTKYSVQAGIYGKLLEINSKLVEDPNLLIDNLNEGFLAVILPDLRRHEENIKSLKSREEYGT